MQRPKSTPRSRTPTTDQFMRLCMGCAGMDNDQRYSNIRAQEIMMNQWKLMGFRWISCCDGQIPSHPIQCGCSRSGDPLYIARATTPGMTTCLGVFHQQSGLCHLIWEGRRFCSKRYEILCQGPVLHSTPSVTKTERAKTPRKRATNPVCTEFDGLGDSLKVQSLRSPLRLSNMFKK